MEPTWTSSDGRHVIYHGDCLEVLLALEPGSVECIVTSPPYNQMSVISESPSGMWADSHGGAGFTRMWNEFGYQDDMDELEYQSWQNAIFAEAIRAVTESGSLFYNHQVRWREGTILHPVLWFRPEGWALREEIIWDRGGGMMLNARMFCRFDERVLWFDKGMHKWNQQSTCHGTIWRIARHQQQQGKSHPLQFPLEIPLRCILAITDVGDVVADPFMGSGTTGVACIRTGRRFVGIEIERRYVDIAIRRLERELAQARLPFDEQDPQPVQAALWEEK